jgi:GH43 family beta-xylosidase
MKGLFILATFQMIWLTIGANTFTNPINDHGADPWMQYHNGNYYFTATTGGSNIVMRKSNTLAGIHSAPDVTIFTLTSPSGNHNMWAPEFHLLNSTNGLRWYLYYTAGSSDKDFGTQRIHVLESHGTDPMGPYTFKADFRDPKDDGFELDPSILKHNGKLYLIGSYTRGLQDLFIRPLSNPWTPSGPKVKLSTPTNSWETKGMPVNEGPEPLYHNGKTFIVYSASFCGTPDYKLGLLTLTGSDPLNPAHWTKSGPVFQRQDANHVYGPGHNGFFTSPDGKEDWIVYHANTAASGVCDGARSTRAQKFTWNSDGTPNFGTPVALGVSLQSPSGEH